MDSTEIEPIEVRIHRALYKGKKWFLLRDLTFVKKDEEETEYFECPFSKKTDHYAYIRACKEGSRPFPVLTCVHCKKQGFVVEPAGVDIEQDDREDLRYFKGLLTWWYEDTGTIDEPLTVKKAFTLYNNGCPLDLLYCDNEHELKRLVREHRTKGKKTSNRIKSGPYSGGEMVDTLP